MKSAFVAFALMIGVVVVPPYGAVKGSDAAQSIVVAGLTRTFIIHEPARAGSGLRSLVIAFHGGGGQGQGMIRLTHFDKVADEHGFVVVFPDGEARQWNDGRAGVKRSNADDIAFVRALIARLIATDRIDPQRVYATGMSNGGFFSYRLGCELSNQIAAIAPVAATMPVPLDQSCRPARPVPVIAFNGTDDPLVPYAGGAVGFKRNPRGLAISVDATLAMWTRLDGCVPSQSATPLPAATPPDGTQIVRRDGCTNGLIEFYRVEGGGHTWPGGQAYLPTFLIGRTSSALDASETIWSFFTRYHLS